MPRGHAFLRIVPFVQRSDPYGRLRLGVLLEDNETLVDLQAGHFSMREAPSPLLRDPAAFDGGGPHARDVAREVVAWVLSQRPPGATTRLADVRPLDAPRTLG